MRPSDSRQGGTDDSAIASRFVVCRRDAQSSIPRTTRSVSTPADSLGLGSRHRQAHVPFSTQYSTTLDGELVVACEAEITPALLSSLVKSDQAWDSSRAVLVTIWMYYNKFTSGGIPWVSVSRYATRWQLYDYSVSMRNARINAGCFGESWDAPPEECLPEQSQQRWIGAPTSGTTYSLSPSWAGHYISIVDVNYQAGSSTVQLKRGTTTWWLSICIWEGSCGL